MSDTLNITVTVHDSGCLPGLLSREISETERHMRIAGERYAPGELDNAQVYAAQLRGCLEAAKQARANYILAPSAATNKFSELVEALEEAREFIDGQIDVVDGDYGVPAPNKAMQLAQVIDAALAKARVSA